MENEIKEAASILDHAGHAIAFTGAGISVESGIPPFRGEKGIWNKYDPSTLELHYFLSHPEESWKVIRDIFYEFFGEAQPNKAHLGLAALEKKGIIKAVITQNIDNLHQEAGSKKVIEFHGNSKKIICLECGKSLTPAILETPQYLRCPDCSGLLKPDFVFFGENIPQQALDDSFTHAQNADAVLVIGSTGEVYPAAQVPRIVKQHGGKVIEINPEASNFTAGITDVFLQGEGGQMMELLVNEILGKRL